MRRRLHCLIVALLCLNLCVDSARACWHLRRRSPCCPPACATPAYGAWTVIDCGVAPAAWTHEPHVWTWSGHVVVTDRAQCCPTGEPEYVGGGVEIVHDCTPVDGVVTEHVVDQEETHDPQAGADGAVLHSPTTVLRSPGPGSPDLGSPSLSSPSLGAAASADPAQPPTARPVAPQPQVASQVASQEPLPDLRPATPSDDTPRRADKGLTGNPPVPASLDIPEQPTAPRQDAAAAQQKPATEEMPAPASRVEPPAMPAVDDVAVAPPDDMPREENLFDLFAADDEDAGEQGTPADEPEMTEERATDGDDAEPAPATDDAPKPPAQDDPQDDPEEGDAGAVEATADTSVPDEPLRRWTDATGEHHAQGWLVRIGDEEACILKVSGRHTTMALADLSADDQAYVAAVAARLAGRPATAAAGDTAGL